VEHVRRALMKKYGAEKVLKDGLRVTAACDLRLQGVARDALNKGLRVHARRQNLLTIPETVPQKDWPARLAALARQNENLRPDEVHEGLVLTVDDEAALRSMREIKAFAEHEPEAILVPSHDPSAWHELRRVTASAERALLAASNDATTTSTIAG